MGHAFIVPAGRRPTPAGCRPTPGEWRDHLTERLARYKLPAHFTFVDDLPRSGSSRVRKADLRKMR
ncbi:AMP-binding enzyme [Actinoplanes sp. CA-054009]